MKRLFSSTVAALALASCEPINLDNLLLSCASTDDCPAGLVCDDDERCTPPPDGPVIVVPVDVDSSSASPALVGRPFFEAGEPLVIKVVLNQTVSPPTVVLVDGLDDVAAVVAVSDDDVDDERGWIARFNVTGDEPERALRVRVDVIDKTIDRVEPTALPTSTAVTFDYTPPAPVAVSLQRRPDPLKTAVAFEIGDDTDIGPAIDVRLVVSSNEAIFIDGDVADVGAGVVAVDDARAPSVFTTGPASLEFARDRSSSDPLIYDLAWPDDIDSGLYDGAHDVVVHLVDLAGNVSNVIIAVVDSDRDGVADSGLVVDATPPNPPTVDIEEAVVFERAPWGRLELGTSDLFRVVAAAGSVEPHARVLITRDRGLRLNVDRVVADDTGAFVGPSDGDSLPLADTDTLYLRAADAAGNVGDVVAIRDVRWIATPLGKVTDSALQNPHRFDEVGLQTASFGGPGARQRDGGDVATLDGRTLATVGAGSWRFASDVATRLSASSSGGGSNSGVIDAMVVTDPLRGKTLLLGRASSVPAQINNQFISQGQCSAPINDLRVRDVRGRWRVGPVPPAAILQGGRPAGTFVPPLAQIVVVARGLTTFTFNGSQWRTACVTDCGVVVADDELPAADPVTATAVPTSLVWDAKRQLLVATLTDNRIAEREAATTSPWRVRRIGLSAAATAFYDARREQLVFASGTTLQAWDGTTLRPLCVGACEATQPPAPAGAVIAHDERNDRFVLFGGVGEVPCNLNTARNVIGSQAAPPEFRAPPATPAPTETWTFDGQAWTRHDVVGPAGRTRHAMRWDPLRQRVVLVGGDDCECIDGNVAGLGAANLIDGFANDTWEWDGASWTRILDAQSPSDFSFAAGSPPAARDHAVVEASGVGGALLRVGNTTHVFRDDAWWRRIADTTGHTGAVMPAVASSPTGEIFIVGGSEPPGGGAFVPTSRHTDRIDTTGGLGFACPEFPPACEIPQRMFGAAAWHDGQRFFVHGGVEFPGSGSNQSALVVVAQGDGNSGATIGALSSARLWSFSPAEGWVARCEGGACGVAPGPRLLHRAVVDGDGRAIVFGGLVGDRATSNETWIFADNRWSTIDPDDGPPARAGHVLAWDAARDAVVVAYGTDLGPQTNQNIFNGPQQPLEPHEIPESLSEVWELEGTTWTQVSHVDVEGDGRPSPRSSVSGAGLPDGGVLLYGGTPSPAMTFGEAADFRVATPKSDEAWVWDGGADAAPAHRFAVRADTLVSKRRADDAIKSLTITWCSTASRTNDVTTIRALQLLWWDGDEWAVVEADERVEADGCVAAVLDDNKARRALEATDDGSLVVAVTTADPNGPAPGRAVLVTDAVEVQVSWRRPAAAP